MKLVKTYLNHVRYPYGRLTAILLLGLSIIFSNLHWNSPSFTPWLAAQKNLVFNSQQYWRLFTSIFVHGDLDHLLSNSLMLLILSYFVSSFYGSLLTIMATLLGGALINYLVLWFGPAEMTIVGISGVIYFLWGFWLILYLFIDKRVSFLRRLVNILGLFFILLIPTSYSPQTSYLAHYLGFFIGITSALIYYPIQSAKFEKYLFYEYRWVPVFEEEET